MNYRFALTAIFCCLLSACGPGTKRPPHNYVSATDTSLAEASYAVSRSISDLAETAEAAHPAQRNLAPPPSPASYGMGGVTSVDWSGPIEPLVRQLGAATNYRVHVLGTPPAIPVIVSINAKNMMAGDILRDVGYQGGERAAVLVFPEARVIELRYAKN
jgi:defect in organelle trafficking protein DotD